MMRIFLVNTFIVMTSCLAALNIVNAQITRDVGEIAVIEADNPHAMIYTAEDSNGDPCLDASGNPMVSVELKLVANKFAQSHPDKFHILIIFTNFDQLVSPNNCQERAGAIFVDVENAIRGIGKTVNGTGRLNGLVNMNNVSPSGGGVVGVTTVMQTMAHEVAHRWGAFVKFDADPHPQIVSPSNNLLGSHSHWSFFFHTPSVTSTGTDIEASSLEGNFWLVGHPTPGQFQTVQGWNSEGYSSLDLYLMGLLSASEVGELWFIKNPNNVDPMRDAASRARRGTVAQGNRTFVTIEDIIAVNGTRIADYPNTFGIFRHAFILLTKQGVDVTQSELKRMDNYRVTWEKYFAEKTQNRGAVVTNLSNVVFSDRAYHGIQYGTLIHPFGTIRQGRDASAPGGTLVVTTGSYPENLTFNSSLTLRAVKGPVTIGQ